MLSNYDLRVYVVNNIGKQEREIKPQPKSFQNVPVTNGTVWDIPGSSWLTGASSAKIWNHHSYKYQLKKTYIT